MRYATTFSGIGGWEIGLNACGWELAWQCEREPFCRDLLWERFGVPICPDIRELPEWLARQFGSIAAARVDALIGSPPCQPFSVAGARRGASDARHLYPAFIRAVGLLQPRWVLMEQVPNVRSIQEGKVFAEYVGGLAALGYDLVWHCLPAYALGAPHQRDRLWIVAHSQRAGDERRGQREESGESEAGRANPFAGPGAAMAHAHDPERRTHDEPAGRAGQGHDGGGDVPHAHGGGAYLEPQPVAGSDSPAHAGGDGPLRPLSDASRELPHGTGGARDGRAESPDGGADVSDASGPGCEECHLAALQAVRDTLPGFLLRARTTTGQLNPTWVEWLMGFPLGWTVSKVWAMRCFLNSRSSLARRSTKLKGKAKTKLS